MALFDQQLRLERLAPPALFTPENVGVTGIS